MMLFYLNHIGFGRFRSLAARLRVSPPVSAWFVSMHFLLMVMITMYYSRMHCKACLVLMNPTIHSCILIPRPLTKTNGCSYLEYQQ